MTNFVAVRSSTSDPELFDFCLCLFNITKIYLPVIGKFFFNGFVYSFCYSIL